MLGFYDYPKTASHPAFNLTLKVNFADGGGENSSFRFVGKNFFASVRSRKKPVEDAVFGFRAAGPALASNRSYFENRVIAWDPETMKATPV